MNEFDDLLVAQEATGQTCGNCRKQPAAIVNRIDGTPLCGACISRAYAVMCIFVERSGLGDSPIGMVVR